MRATPDSTLTNPEQRIADLERQLAERTAERDEAERQLAEKTIERNETIAQQIATAEVLQVINASPGDLAPVFGAILEKAAHLCEAPFGLLRPWDGERFHFGAVYGDAKFGDWLRQLGPRPASAATPLGRIKAGERVLQIADAQNDAGFSTPAGLRDFVEVSGIRSTVIVALHRDDVLFGAITLYRQEVRPFTDKQIALLQNFAAQAVIAMENARLLTETREALEQQTATAEVLQVINSSPGHLAPVFDAMLERAIRLCEATYGHMFTYDGELFHLAAISGPPRYVEWSSQLGPVRSGPSAPLGRISRGERIVHVTDVREEDVYHTSPGFREQADRRGVRSQITIALLKDDVLLGAMVVYRQEVRPFTDKQIALLQNFAAQAVIAMENARLLTETREALEQQTATAEVLQVINSSPGDLAPVFDAMLENATRLCEAPCGALRIWDGERFHVGAVHGEPVFSDWLRQRGPHRPPAEDPLGRIIEGEGVVHFADAPDDPGYMASPGFKQAVEVSGMRSGITVPLRKDDAVLGAITVYRQEVRPFSDKQIALLKNFAAQAVIAMENARLIIETREALEQQTATTEVLQVINSSPGNLPPVFDAILKKAHTLCGAAHGNLWTYDGELFHPVATPGNPRFAEWLRDHSSVPPGPGTVLERIVRGEAFVQSADAASDEAFCTSAYSRKVIEVTGARTTLVVSLRKDTALLGVIFAYRQEVRPFSEKQITLLQNFADQAVIAMENARLLGELRQRTEEVAELNRGLEGRVAEQVEELGRVGRLKRFLAPQLAELIVSHGDEKILESHRREIVVVFCDLRGYTAFTETAEPEEVLDFLREYHGALGPLVSQFEGTLDQFSGDGIMVFFNDPVPCPDPAERAVKMAMAMREAAGTLIASWRRRGRLLGFGAGIAQV
jgi:GAF domain-containing protein